MPRHRIQLFSVTAAGLCVLLICSPAASWDGESDSADRWALVIGIDGYQALGKLTTCRNDARAMAKVLSGTAEYPESRVVLLTDDAAAPQNRPTLATMKRRIKQVSELARPSDAVLVYFSGHGVTRDGKGYLVPADGDAENAIALDWVKDTLAASQAQSRLLILDACHAGSAAKGVSGIAPSLAGEGGGLVMLLSSGRDQVSYPEEEGSRSVFSRFLTDGLAGKADADSDGAITFDEVFSYIERSMIDWSLETGKTQTPVLCPRGGAAVVLARTAGTGKGDLQKKLARARALAAEAEAEPPAERDYSAAVSLLDEILRETVDTDPSVNRGATDLLGEISRFVEAQRKERDPGDRIVETARLVSVVLERLGGAQEGRPDSTQQPPLRVPQGFRPAAGTKPEPYTNTGYALEVIHEKTGIEMVFIPAGEFMMGLDSGSSDAKLHRVRLTRPFYMGKYEVTQGQWQREMGSNPSRFKGDRNPAEKVSWHDCQSFLSLTGGGLRLPTEAEWEYACRAGTTTAYSFGSDSGDLGRYAWYKSNSGETTHAVGGKLPNAWGLYDMHGNVWEWCSDWHGPYGEGPTTDPRGPSSGGPSPGCARIGRGGAWTDAAVVCGSAWRFRGPPARGYDYLGFRVVRGL